MRTWPAAKLLLMVFTFWSGSIIAAQPVMRGDFDGDQTVSWSDLPGFANAWAQAHAGGSVSALADVVVDRKLDYNDADWLLQTILSTPQLALSPSDSVQAEIEWADDVSLIGPTQLPALVSADLENRRFVLDAAAASRTGVDLAPGKILMIYGTAVSRIISCSAQGSSIVVQAEPARLTDAIVNGDISWTQQVRFGPGSLLPTALTGPALPQAGQYVPDVEFSAGGYNFKLHVEPATFDDGGRTVEGLLAVFTVTKSVGGAIKVRLELEGRLQNFGSRDTISIRGGQLMDFRHRGEGMKGTITLRLAAQASGRDDLNLECPVTLLEIPVGPPLLGARIGIGAQFVVNCYVPLDGSSVIEVTFTYDSDLGFRYQGATARAEANIGDAAATPHGDPRTGASSPISANWGVGFPRMSLSILGETVVGWMQPAYLIGGDFVIIPKPCQRAQALFLAAAGADLKFFGIEVP
ncbi:MAG: hypothetical protein H5T86_06960, partial [Armatimonadetes bacterium]|nr:hypothetical protein [Armatimonadota bacterium]